MKELQSGNAAEINEAVGKLRSQAVPPHVIRHQVWERWVPELIRLQRFDDAVQICELGIENRPTEAAGPLLQLEVKALLGWNKPQQALQAAKSFYNVCPLANSPDGVELIGTCFAALHPDDRDIASRLANQQAILDSGNGASGSSEAPSTEPSSTVPTIKTIQVDEAVYKSALAYWARQTSKFQDRVAYATVLLAAGRTQDAEQVLRDLYVGASSPIEVKTSVEGIARSLRAEDGNVARANAWLLSLQQTQNSDTNK